MAVWWLSFSKDGTNQGAAVVEAESLEDAIRVSWREGCNPGGSVSAYGLTDAAREKIPEVFELERNRLYTAGQLKALGVVLKMIGP